MPNFFTDNEDILFHMRTMDLSEIVALFESDYAEAREYDYAPENYEDAMDNYMRVLQVTGAIAGDFIAPRAEAIDRVGAQFHDGKVELPAEMKECIKALSDADLMGFTLPRKYGGLNCPTTLYTIAIEIVSRADASLMNLFGLQGIAETICAYADDEAKDKYLPRFSSGELSGAMVLTEPDAGSDLQHVQTKATPVNEEKREWVLNGVKRFITNGCGDVLLVLARSEEGVTGGRGLSLFICEKDKGVRVRRIEEKLGIHGSPTCELQFTNAPGRLVGERRRGLTQYTMALMNGARLAIAAQGLGVAEAAYRAAREYAEDRVQFGKAIKDIPAVADMLAQMRMRIEICRSITYEAARFVDLQHGLEAKAAKVEDAAERRALQQRAKHAQRIANFLTPVSKYIDAELSVDVSSMGIQVLGGSGYMQDYPLERHYRDARIIPIYEGTTQLQMVAAVGGVTSGVIAERFKEMAQQTFTKTPKELQAVAPQAEALLAESVEFVRARKDRDYTDLYARPLVDMAVAIYAAYLLMGEAELDDRKALIAEHHLRTLLPKVRMLHDLVLSGDDLAVREIDTIARMEWVEE